MMQLTWDDELEQAALVWAHASCINGGLNYDAPECRRTKSYSSIGQNIAGGSFVENETVISSSITQAW